MVQLAFEGNSYVLLSGESVLACLLRNGVELSYSCKSGICQSCLIKVSKGDIPEISQSGLKPTVMAQGCALACQLVPEVDLTLQRADDAGLSIGVQVLEAFPANDRVTVLRLKPEETFEGRGGQYLNLIRGDGLSRSYSIANIPEQDGYVELHIGKIPNGQMSTWVNDNLSAGAKLSIRGAAGNCFYANDDDPQDTLLLVGTGTGLAPLIAIAKDALRHQHQGDIHLYHGALKAADLYFVEDLKALAHDNPSFFYHPYVLEEGTSYPTGDLQEVVLKSDSFQDPSSVRAFVCGAPEFVNSMKMKVFLAGVPSSKIYSDAFLIKSA